MAADADRLRDELRRMRELIQKDPAVMARFDTDENGAIDGHEWEQVRRLVAQRLEREEAETREASRLAAKVGEAFHSTQAPPGAVARAIHEADLSSVYGPDPLPGAIGDADEIVLERPGGISQLFEGVARRSYRVFSADGSQLGSIEQVENGISQDLTNRSVFEIPDLHFRVGDAGTSTITSLRRSQGFAQDSIDVTDSTGLRASVEWKLSLLGSMFAIQSACGGSAIAVKGSILHPFTLQILDDVGDPIGQIERGWSGLGAFLTGGNRTRIRVQPGEVSPDQRWGLLAAALLADLSAESKD